MNVCFLLLYSFKPVYVDRNKWRNYVELASFGDWRSRLYREPFGGSTMQEGFHLRVLDDFSAVPALSRVESDIDYVLICGAETILRRIMLI